MNLSEGWIDPGYKGGFSRQPKWVSFEGNKRIVRPGDVLGFGQVYYFPNGVERPYGTAGNNWQGNMSTRII